MPQVFTSAVAGAPAGEVWALLRDFASLRHRRAGTGPVT